MRITEIDSNKTRMEHLASGLQITRASDNPARLAIANKLEIQERGYDAAQSNTETSNDLLQTADGALENIQDSLQRIRELGVQASNSAIYSSSDREAMQEEVDQLKQSIQDSAKGTQFNTIKLLDGSMADMNVASNPSGKGISIKMVNSTLESMGIADFNLTKNFDLSTIDAAIDKVAESRGSIGASSNGMTYVMSYNSSAALNNSSAKSKIEDLDYGKTVTDTKKEQVMEQYRIFTQKNQLNQESLLQTMFL